MISITDRFFFFLEPTSANKWIEMHLDLFALFMVEAMTLIQASDEPVPGTRGHGQGQIVFLSM